MIRCKECDCVMFCIHDEEIRDTCHECGGEAKISYEIEKEKQND